MRNTPPTPRRVRSAHDSRSATVRAAAAAPSRRQQSRWQREQHQQHLLFIAVGVLVGLVALIFAGGLFYDNVVRANATVAQVGPDSITASQLVAEMAPSVRAIDAQVKQAGPNANAAAYSDQQKRSLPDQTINSMIDQTLVNQEASRRGIIVSPAELDDRERQTVADFTAASTPTPAPSDAPTSDATTTAADATPVPTSAPTAAGTPTPAPTLASDAYGPGLQQLLDLNSLSEAEFRDRLQRSMLQEKLQTTIGQEQSPDVQEQVHARQIVQVTEDQANSILQQLQGGADFTQLAKAQSIDTKTNPNGGDLGWVPRGVQDKVFDDTAFALNPGDLSSVVHLTSGYAVIQVIEKDPARPVAPDVLATLRQKAFSSWLDSRRTSQDVKLQLDGPERDWVLTKIGVRP